MTDAERVLPLFPLEQVVLFPGMSLPLRIFEERYKVMIGACQVTDQLFGVLLIRSGSEVGAPAQPERVGCTARMLRIDRLPDGRMTILTIGEQRFRLHGPWRPENDASSGSAERTNTGELVSRIFRAQRRTIAVGHAARVVEIEEHRRTLRYRFEQVTEFPERVRTNDILIEVDEIVRLGRALGRVDVEVILPEIGHDFLELALARDRARYP